jgi:hypothetical protein
VAFEKRDECRAITKPRVGQLSGNIEPGTRANNLKVRMAVELFEKSKSPDASTRGFLIF